jgi:CubicO group peptidase (beta-lactamase class C family)
MGWGLVNANVVVDPSGLAYPARRGELSWDGTAGTIFWADPADELVIVLMTQVQPTNPGGIRQRFKTAIQNSEVEAKQ